MLNCLFLQSGHQRSAENLCSSNNLCVFTLRRGKYVTIIITEVTTFFFFTFGAVSDFYNPPQHIYVFPFSLVHCLPALQISYISPLHWNKVSWAKSSNVFNLLNELNWKAVNFQRGKISTFVCYDNKIWSN